MKFTKLQFEIFEQKLIKKGYKKYNQKHRESDLQYFKTFRDNDKKAYLVCVLVYDWNKYPQLIHNNLVISVMLEFMLVNEHKVSRLDLTMSDDKYSLDGFEKFSAKFYNLIKSEL